jgi:hypothetical protein
MMNARYRPVAVALAVLAVAWLAAWGGFRLAASYRMTAEKFTAFTRTLDLDKLQGEERARALKELAERLNRLPTEERRRVRMGLGRPDRLFQQMTEQEKGAFIEATMPTGFKQMIASFEQMPEDQRKRALERATRQLRNRAEGETATGDDGPRPQPVSADLQKKIVTLGLKTFYQESSAQTKAQVAPLLEEIQHAMESGHLFHP